MLSLRMFIWVLILWFSPAALSAQQPADEQPAGIILALIGEAQIHNQNRTIPAIAGAQLFAGDSVSTSSDGWMQIAFFDETMVTIPANSQYQIISFSAQPGNRSFLSQLITGSLKFISGKYAASDPDVMRVKFGTVTAAIRGTSGIISQRPDGRGSVTILSGIISVLNPDNQPAGRLRRSGWGMDISADGTVSELIKRSDDVLSALLQDTSAPLQPSTTRNRTTSTPASSQGLQQPVQTARLTELLSGDDYTQLAPYQRALLEQLDETKREDETNDQITLDRALLDLALSGEQPLWASYFTPARIGNPPAPYQQLDYDLYQRLYRNRVSERYQGSVSFAADNIPLRAVNGFDGQGFAGFSATFDYDSVSISGDFWVREVRINTAQFEDSAPSPLSLPPLQNGDLLVDIEIGSSLISAPQQGGITPQADTRLSLSLGSITDGRNVMDGRLGVFGIEITPQGTDTAALAAQAVLAGELSR